MSFLERAYLPLKNQEFVNGKFAIVPIRDKDKYLIMQWRNEQIYHLRQQGKLTEEIQDRYFDQTIAELFTQDQPSQILFSFLKNNEIIGYGGLVHIAWPDKNAEVSFVMNTSHQNDFFGLYWTSFLTLLKRVAFKELGFRKIFTYAFDIRPRLYPNLLKAGFIEECRLKDHCLVDDKFRDVLIHSCMNPRLDISLRYAEQKDADLLFKWANDSGVRSNAINSEPISWEGHLKWFSIKLNSSTCKILIFSDLFDRCFGQVRLDSIDGIWEIDYSVDELYRGLGLGKLIISAALKELSDLKFFKAIVKPTNIVSLRVFRGLGFDEVSDKGDYMIFRKTHE